MASSFKKRLASYLIDGIVFMIFMTLVGVIIPQSKNQQVLNSKISDIGEQVLKDEITMSEYYNQYVDLTNKLDKELMINNIISCLFIIGYFAVLPFYYGGKTIGKKWMKIKIKKSDDSELTMNDLIVRNMIINQLGYTLICLSTVFLLTPGAYFITIGILGFIQVLLVIISVFMILYRKDKKGLHDLICNTCVVEEI